MIPKATLLFGFLGATAALVAAAPRAPSADTTSSAAIQIDNFHYSPPMLVVAPGTTVTWTNDDDSPHSVLGVRTVNYVRGKSPLALVETPLGA